MLWHLLIAFFLWLNNAFRYIELLLSDKSLIYWTTHSFQHYMHHFRYVIYVMASVYHLKIMLLLMCNLLIFSCAHANVFWIIPSEIATCMLQTKTHICLITDYYSGGELFLLLDRQPTKVLKEDAVRLLLIELFLFPRFGGFVCSKLLHQKNNTIISFIFLCDFCSSRQDPSFRDTVYTEFPIQCFYGNCQYI